MNSAPSVLTDAITDALNRAGVSRFAITDVSPVADESRQRYDNWIADGGNASMDYLSRYGDVRNNPQQLLPDAQSIICCAFSYWHPDSFENPYVAAYALGDDYHDVVRRRLAVAASEITAVAGGETRVCVDTAPLRERYWAARSGLGAIGRSGQLIVKGVGTYVFLGEILTTARLPRMTTAEPIDACLDCGRCVRACPTGALQSDSSVDARRCLSYLTIEYRGDFPEGTDLHGRLYGCDICARVCPHNIDPEITRIDEFRPRPEILALTPERVVTMTQTEFSAVFRRSAMKRVKLAGLVRNARWLLGQSADGSAESAEQSS